MKLNKQAGGGFRETLAELVHAGLIVKGDGWGYMLPPTKTPNQAEDINAPH